MPDEEYDSLSLSEIYSELDLEIDEDEFRERVDDKVEQMGGLCDEPTAAKLVAHELEEDRVYDIADVTAEKDEVRFVGKVTSVGEPKEFERDEGEDGMVANVRVRDETGEIRVALWDEYAASVGELEKGDVLKVKGAPKDGWNGGVEINAREIEVDDDDEFDVDVDTSEGAVGAGDVSAGASDVTVVGRVLETSEPRTFDRDDGEGKVANIAVGDETGWVRVALWDDRADDVSSLGSGDVVRVRDGYARERDGGVEVNVGSRGSVERVAEDELEDEVEFHPDPTPVVELEIDETYDVAGVVTDTGETRTFDRDDGSQGKVRNVRLRDDTGEVRVALWGDKADLSFAPGDEVAILNMEAQEGWNDGVEGSVNWASTVYVRSRGSLEGEEDGERSEAGLDSFT
ncbi:MAG: replication factor A1 [Methanobacteriota archaeon]|jgi:replication factor A1|uniref:OB-fold nucleic acid binding domain-containing protein n=1 Tax=Halorutilus salinus TaxID=2487751 RepID=A0A9Q4C2S2_9EURY|nr:OB-fold nucleic acid binding domain-containing protein [Halorutilus salinus]MCX2818403.1 OB-fold nucleic acid binding domain-containing protein [Halorutilus salinus]